MKKSIFWFAVLFVVIFIEYPFKLLFPEYSRSTLNRFVATSVSDYLKQNYSPADLEIKNPERVKDWKVKKISEGNANRGFLKLLRREEIPKKRDRKLYIQILYLTEGQSSWSDAKVSKLKLTLNIDETKPSHIIVSKATN